jgi:hypothetical protein
MGQAVMYYYDARLEPPNWRLAILYNAPIPKMEPVSFQMPMLEPGKSIDMSRINKISRNTRAAMGYKRSRKGKDKEVNRTFNIRIKPDRSAQVCLRHLLEATFRIRNTTVRYLNQISECQNKEAVVQRMLSLPYLTSENLWIAQIPPKLLATKIKQMVGIHNHLIKKRGPGGFEMNEVDKSTAEFLSLDVDAWRGTKRHFFCAISRSDEEREHDGDLSRVHGHFTLARGYSFFPDGTPLPEQSRHIPFADSPWLVNELLQHGLYRSFSIKWDIPTNHWFLVIRLNIGGF